MEEGWGYPGASGAKRRTLANGRGQSPLDPAARGRAAYGVRLVREYEPNHLSGIRFVLRRPDGERLASRDRGPRSAEVGCLMLAFLAETMGGSRGGQSSSPMRGEATPAINTIKSADLDVNPSASSRGLSK